MNIKIFFPRYVTLTIQNSSLGKIYGTPATARTPSTAGTPTTEGKPTTVETPVRDKTQQ
jgi:hypothetical protein